MLHETRSAADKQTRPVVATLLYSGAVHSFL
jgi:hypothetical protein